MREAVIGFDTSNYRSSVAVVTLEGEILYQFRELLRVPEGERGLRQSDAVFAHVRNLQAAWEPLRAVLRETRPVALAASVRPRDPEDSYMPVFHVGKTMAGLLAATLDVPCFETTHQRGHLAAAARGTELEEAERFLALHLSGGTTDLLRVERDRIEPLGGSLDLHAGQLVDRVGVALGLGFPSGPELEKLAERGSGEGRLGCSMAEGDLCCHFSGAEAQALRWIRDGEVPREQIAREVYDLLARTIARMLCAGSAGTGLRRALVTGGVASSELFRSLLRDRLRKRRGAPEVCFGAPELSGDNAVGVALTGLRALRESKSTKGREDR